MVIGIDIDDTITDTYAYMFPYSQKYTIEDLGKNIENIDRNCMTHMYTTTFHKWNEKEEKGFLDKYYEATLKNLKPRLFAVEVIKKLKEKGNTILLITARFPSDKFDVEELTKRWLKDNKINYDKLILNAQDKVKFAKDNQVDVFIDDSIKNCKAMSEANIKTYMMDTIINLNDKNDKVKRVYSWPHLYQEIMKLKEEN